MTWFDRVKKTPKVSQQDKDRNTGLLSEWADEVDWSEDTKKTLREAGVSEEDIAILFSGK